MRRRSWPAALAAALLTAGCAGVGRPPAAPPAGSAPAGSAAGAAAASAAPAGIALTSVRMLDAVHGWAVTASGEGVLATADGGRTWQDATPAPLASPGAGAILLPATLDATTAWLAAVTPGQAATIYRTTDGGASWTAGATFPVEFGDGGGQLLFINGSDGWLELLTAGNGTPDGQLFRTQDGGQTWTWIGRTGPATQGNLPFGGALSFRNATTGWLTGGPRASGDAFHVWLFRTGDGGQTWAQQALPLPLGRSADTVSLSPPRFFGSSGVMLAQFSGAAPAAATAFTTADGGSTWSLTALVPVAGARMSFADPLHGWMAGSGPTGAQVLYGTSDGGIHWTVLRPAPAEQIDFISASTGWAVGPGSLFQTVNGGVTWTRLPDAAA